MQKSYPRGMARNIARWSPACCVICQVVQKLPLPRKIGGPGSVGPPGGTQYLYATPAYFFCIFYFLYGLVSMTHHTAPAHCVSMTPSVELRGYIPAGTRPSLHTNVYSVKYFLFLLTISVIYLNIVTWVVSYTVYSHNSVQLRL